MSTETTPAPASSGHPARAISGDPLERFLSGQLTERTRSAYCADLREFFGSGHITPKRVAAVTFTDIIDFRNALAARGRKRSTINRKLASLKAFFRMMAATGLIERNPADASLVRGYRLDEAVSGKSLERKELQRIIDIVGEEQNPLIRARDLAILHLLTFAGLRRSEVANVRWTDLTEEGAFHLLRLTETKSGVPQDVKLQPIVLHYLELYRQTLELGGFPVVGHAFISLARNRSRGKPISDQSINAIVRKHARRAGVTRNVTAHMFRHTCCTLSIEGGAKPQQVQAHLRHKDLKTTMRYYENRERLTDNASDYIHIR